MLARNTLSGYDLARKMKKPIGFFWRARHSQIYPELARLEAQGLVTHQVVEQTDRPDKKIYSITDAGRASLRAWATEPVEPTPDRSEIVLKAYSVWLADPEKAIQLYRAQERYHLSQLAEYEQILTEIEQKHGPNTEWRVDTPLFGDYATLRRGVVYEREYAQWCHWMIEQLEKHREHYE